MSVRRPPGYVVSANLCQLSLSVVEVGELLAQTSYWWVKFLVCRF